MADTKMLQMILDKVTTLDKKVDSGFKEVKEQFVEVNKRIDKIVIRLDDLEEDAPTVAEFDALEGRVQKLEDLQLDTA